MPAQSHLLQKAISFYQAGDWRTSRRLLLGILRTDESNQAAWLWYADTFSNLEERAKIYRNALAKYPQMDQVHRAYQRLQQNGQKQATPAAKPVSAPPPKPAERSFQQAVTWSVQTRRAAQPKKRSSPARNIFTVLAIFALLSSTLFYSAQAGVARNKVSGLQQEKSRLENNYRLTLLNLQQLEKDHRTLNGQFESLTAQNNVLSQRFDSLNQKYSSLDTEHLRLQKEYTTLADTYNNLNTQHKDLENRYATLSGDYVDLNSKAVVPPYITVRQRDVILAFYKRDGTILYWTVPFENLEKDIERGYARRKEIFSPAAEITLTNHAGDEYLFVDYRPFVDPSDFTEVMAKLYADAESDDAFIREVWNIVTQLTSYALDPEVETPRYPLETLLAGGGDCEDTSILFASMIKAAPVSWTVSLIYMNADNPTDASDPNHLAVEVSNGSTNYLIETTSAANMTPYTQGVSGWFLEIQ